MIATSLVFSVVLGVRPPGPVNVVPRAGDEPPPAQPREDPPPPRLSRLAPKEDGAALLANGIAFGLIGLTGHALIVGVSLRKGRSSWDGCRECVAIPLGLAMLADPAVGAGLGIIAAGAARRARWEVHHGRRITLRPVLGMSLFFVGAATWLAGQLGGGFACRGARCMLGVREGTYWGSVPFSFVGVGLWGRGGGASFQRWRESKERPHVSAVSFGPRGLAVSLRF